MGKISLAYYSIGCVHSNLAAASAVVEGDRTGWGVQAFLALNLFYTYPDWSWRDAPAALRLKTTGMNWPRQRMLSRPAIWLRPFRRALFFVLK